MPYPVAWTNYFVSFCEKAYFELNSKIINL